MDTLMVVEDEKMIRQGIVIMAKRSGVPIGKVLECRNGLEALDRLREQPADVVITDIRMPKMDGIQLADELSRMQDPPFIVVVSGYDDFGYAVEMMKHGVKDYILKPVKREEIERILTQLDGQVEQKKREREEARRAFQQNLKSLILYPESVSSAFITDLEYQLRGICGREPFRVLVAYPGLPDAAAGPCVCIGAMTGGMAYLCGESCAAALLTTEPADCSIGAGGVHDSLRELPAAFAEALQARKVAYVRCCPREVYSQYSFEESPELERIREYFLPQVSGNRLEDAKRKLWNAFFQGRHLELSPLQLVSVTESLCRELSRVYGQRRAEEADEAGNCPLPLDFVNADAFLSQLETWLSGGWKEICEEYESGQSTEKIRKALQYIKENYQKDLNMAMVSNYVSMNYSLFSSAFKEYTGVNFVNYLKTLRITEARRLLETTEERISDIGRRVGYENDKHFMKTFKAICGMSPSEYRRDMEFIRGNSANQEDRTGEETT